MTRDGNYASVLSSPTEESLPSYSKTWRDNVTEKEPIKKLNWRSRSQWASAYADTPRVFNTALETLGNGSWPIKRKVAYLEQLIAFLLVFAFGVAPLILLGYFTPGTSYGNGSRPFYDVFQDQVQGCGDSFGTPENSTVSGIEKLFVLGRTFGQFTFSQVKTIDVVWDVVIGRGVQLVAWWVGYVVFSDALLRAIERHPASFRIFQRIALEGPSLISLWTLVKELWCAKSKKTKALFFYMWLATLYIISIPMFLSAMTGYDSTSIAWVNLDDSSNNIVPASSLAYSWVAHGTWNETWDNKVCLNYSLANRIHADMNVRTRHCNCQLSDGNIVNASTYSDQNLYYNPSDLTSTCRFDFPGNNQNFNITRDDTYLYGYPETLGTIKSCATTFNISVNGKTYDAAEINGTSDYCYGNTSYSFVYLQSKSRCLPDTSNPRYQWGFSIMLSGLFVMFHFAWALTMYIVWQDAQFGSSLVQMGYQMTPLRAAFAMAKAAKRKTGLGEKQLVRANTKELEQELYGTRKTKGTKVEYTIFEDSDEEHGRVDSVRRRMVGPKDDDEVVVISTPCPATSDSTLSGR